MSWKDEMVERKQRKEAQRFFRQNNDEFFSTAVWIKLILVTFGMAIACGVAYGAFVMLTHLQAAYILALLGVGIARVMKKVAGTGNEKVAILTIISYILAILFSYVFSYAFEYFLAIDFGNIFQYIFSPMVWKTALQAITHSGLFTGLIFVIGGYYAYQNAKY